MSGLNEQRNYEPTFQCSVCGEKMVVFWRCPVCLELGGDVCKTCCLKGKGLVKEEVVRICHTEV